MIKSKRFWRPVVVVSLILLATITAGVTMARRGGLAILDEGASQIQCGHWCVRRCCELLGVPVEMPEILRLMPPQRDGHSLLQLTEILERIGLEAEGRRESLATLKGCALPLIAHMKNPNHFIVVTSISGNRVHFFDSVGDRTSRTLEAFELQWSGFVLLVHRASSGGLPAWMAPASQPSPRIQFDTLFVDAGEVRSSGKPVSFRFHFQNLGNRGLEIKKINVDCKCMKGEKPTDVIPPAGHGEIKLVYGPEGERGPFFHEAVVETNDAVIPLIRLKVSGRSDEIVSLQPARLEFGKALIGSSAKAVLFLRYFGDRDDFTVTTTACSMSRVRFTVRSAVDFMRSKEWWPGLVSNPQPPRGVGIVELEWSPDASQEGPNNGSLTIGTNINGYENIPVNLSGTAVPPVVIRPNILYFGEVSPRAAVEACVTVVSAKSERFRLVSIDPDNASLHHVFSPVPGQTKAEIRFTTTGATALSLKDTTLKVRLAIGKDSEMIELPVVVYAHPRGALQMTNETQQQGPLSER